MTLRGAVFRYTLALEVAGFLLIIAIIWLDEIYQPVRISLIGHGRVWSDDVNPYFTGVQWHWISLCIDEMHGADES